MDDLQMLATVLTTPDPSGEAVDRGRHQLHKTMRGPIRKRRTGRLATGLGLTAAAATAAVVVASGTTAPTPTPNSPPTAAQPSGRQILLAAATTAERTPQGSGTYWYVKTVFADSKDGKPPQQSSESWTRRDGQTWIRGDKTHGKIIKITQPGHLRLGGPDVSFGQLQKLPTEPDALQAWVADTLKHSDVKTSAGRPNATMQKRMVFSGLISLISQLPAPPKVRAAAFRAIASYPNVNSLGALNGGQGLVISLREGEQARLVVDPATSQIRDTNFFVTPDGAQAWLPGTRSATIATEWTNQPPR